MKFKRRKECQKGQKPQGPEMKKAAEGREEGSSLGNGPQKRSRDCQSNNNSSRAEETGTDINTNNNHPPKPGLAESDELFWS